MLVTMFINFLSHHQLPFCLEMTKELGDNFVYVALEPLYQEQKNLGYDDMDKKYPFVLRAYENEENFAKAKELLTVSDVAIFGSCPNWMINYRLKTNKLSIIYTERYFKKGTWRRFIPITYYKIYDRVLKHKNKNLFIICSSAYVPYDLKLLGYNKPTYAWGYFTEVKQFEINNLLERKSDNPVKILCACRFLNWKHVDDAILTAKKLKDNGHRFSMDIIGGGEKESQLKYLVDKLNLQDIVKFLGSMPSNDVRLHMEEANIFLVNSDFNEGWGAVMNEAMSSGCAVVASHAAGSVPLLIKDGSNGFIYKSGDLNDLYKKTESLVIDKELRLRFSTEVYKTMSSFWNAEYATRRFITIIKEKFNSEEITEYTDGPCSQLKIIKNNWYKS